MPVLSKLPTQAVTLPVSGAEAQVSLSYGDKLAISAAYTGEDGSDKMTGSKLMAFQPKVVESGLKSWNLTNEDGSPVPATWESVNTLLDPADGETIVEAILKLLQPKVSSPKGGSTRTS